MDGYELQAQSYEQYLEQHPEQSALVREDIERKIKTLRMFIGTSDADKDEKHSVIKEAFENYLKSKRE